MVIKMEEKTLKPILRFKGFTDTWEQCELGKIGSTYTGLSGKTSNDFGHGEGRYVTYLNVFGNPISNLEMVEKVEIDKSQNQVTYGDVFFTTSSETPEEVGMSSIWLNKKENTYLNSFCFGYRPSIEIDPHYLAYMLRSPGFRSKMVILAQGISRYNISKSKAMQLSISLPTIQEQIKVGKMLDTISNLITLHQHKYDKLVNIKKALLDRMFPNNGDIVPKLRFKGFVDAWEQRNIGELSTLVTKGTTPLDKSGEGSINYVKVENIDPFSGEISNLTKISLDEHTGYLKRSQLQENDILFSIAGTLGRISTVDKAILPANTNQALAIIRLKKGNLRFINTALKGKAVVDYIRKNPTVGAQPNLSLEQVKSIIIDYPKEDEQEKIGLFFDGLEKLITLHQRKHEKLVNIKKALLQKMFV